EPEMALGITFTNKAAGELSDRLRIEFPDLTADGREVQVSTYHGFAYEVLREFGALVGVERDATLIAPAHQRQMIEGALGAVRYDHLDLTYPSGIIEKVFTLAGQVGDNLLDAAEVAAAAPHAEARDAVWETRLELLSLVDSYTQAKATIGVVDYGDLVGRAHRLVTQHPAVAARIRSRYQVVLLDEYQDTDPAQRELLRAVFGDGFPVTAVGDSDQTIYEWRGASRLNFDGFVHHFPNADRTDATTLPLTLNRRSDRVIIDLANRIRGRLHGDTPFDPLEPGPDAGIGEIETGWLGTRSEEAAWIAARIEEAHDAGIPWNEIAVLVRKNKDITSIREALVSTGVPTEVTSVGGLLEIPEIAEVVAWLQILDDPSASTSVVRILLGSAFRLGLGDLTPLAAWVRQRRRHTDVEPSLIEAIDSIEQIHGCSQEASDRLADFRSRYARLLVETQSVPVPVLCRSVLAEMQAWTEIDAMDDHASLSTRLNLYRFLDLVESWKPVVGKATLTSFLEYLSLLSDESAPQELDTVAVSRGPAVAILTIHRAKGLEWDTVVIPSVVDGGFPSQSRSYASPIDKAEYLPYSLRLDAESLPDLSGAEKTSDRNAILRSYHEAEEWRTAYVAVTRARHQLIMTGSHRTAERKTPRVPSPLFTMASKLAGTTTFVDDPGPIEESRWEAPEPAPDPLFSDSGWNAVLREAVNDAEWLDAYPEHKSAAVNRASQLRLELESLPQPTVAERPIAKATSVTGLVTLARCPLQFRWAFVERLPQRPSPALHRGVQFHRSVELHNLGKVPLVDLDEIAYDLTGEQGGERGASRADPYEVFLDSRFADRKARFAEVPIDLSFGSVRVRGRIDAVYEAEPGRWEIVDYKSGRPSDDPALDVQLQVYAIAAADGAVAQPAPVDLSVTFAFFGGGAYAERSIDVDDVWLGAARERVDDLSSSFERDEFEPTPSEACRRCDFVSFCEAGRTFLNR
ncbi:MAG: ATP-dependent DNA helicase, partial [Actinomycetota bacterium]|nr:ATP-dependent DNA helicase [Actinomycetota bacterium]